MKVRRPRNRNTSEEVRSRRPAVPVRTLAVNVATVVVVVVIGGQGGAQVQVLALEVEPLLEHDLWPEHLHRKTRRRRRLSASRRNGDVLATPLSLSLSGPQVLVSRGKRERENGKKFLKGTNRKRRGCREALSQQILVECVSCRQAASASATPRDERIERGGGGGFAFAYLGRHPPLLLHHHPRCSDSSSDAILPRLSNGAL